MSDARRYAVWLKSRCSSQGQGRKPFKAGNPAVFKSYLLRHLQWELTIDHGFLNYRHNIQIWSGRIFDIRSSFCVTWLKLAQMSVAKSRPSPYRANFLKLLQVEPDVKRESFETSETDFNSLVALFVCRPTNDVKVARAEGRDTKYCYQPATGLPSDA